MDSLEVSQEVTITDRIASLLFELCPRADPIVVYEGINTVVETLKSEKGSRNVVAPAALTRPSDVIPTELAASRVIPIASTAMELEHFDEGMCSEKPDEVDSLFDEPPPNDSMHIHSYMELMQAEDSININTNAFGGLGE